MNDDLVGNFTDIDSVLRERLWVFLNEPAIVQAMIDASDKGQPATGAVGQELANRFDPAVRLFRVKTFIGHLIRLVMENNGYKLSSRPRKKAQANPMFGTGSLYIPLGASDSVTLA